MGRSRTKVHPAYRIICGLWLAFLIPIGGNTIWWMITSERDLCGMAAALLVLGGQAWVTTSIAFTGYLFPPRRNRHEPR